MGDGIKIRPKAEELQAMMFMSAGPGLHDCKAQVAGITYVWECQRAHPIKV